jgi:acylphosphatase
MSPSSEVVARRVTVHGRVQGVFFRDTCRRLATSRRVAGWVRNCADGSVEAWFEGPPDAVAALIDWAGRGPAHAEVSGVDVEDVEPSGATTFDIT